jgi:hypothetical protein
MSLNRQTFRQVFPPCYVVYVIEFAADAVRLLPTGHQRQNWARAGSTLARYLADQDGRFSRQRRPSSTDVCCSMFECREWAASSYNGLNSLGFKLPIIAMINQPLGAIIMKGNACQRFLAITPPDLDEVKDGLEERWQSRHREPLKRQSVTAPNACALFGRRKLRVSASTPTLPSAHPSIYANDGPRSRYHNACIGRRGFLPRASRSDAPS